MFLLQITFKKKKKKVAALISQTTLTKCGEIFLLFQVWEITPKFSGFNYSFIISHEFVDQIIG